MTGVLLDTNVRQTHPVGRKNACHRVQPDPLHVQHFSHLAGVLPGRVRSSGTKTHPGERVCVDKIGSRYRAGTR